MRGGCGHLSPCRPPHRPCACALPLATVQPALRRRLGACPPSQVARFGAPEAAGAGPCPRRPAALARLAMGLPPVAAAAPARACFGPRAARRLPPEPQLQRARCPVGPARAARCCRRAGKHHPAEAAGQCRWERRHCAWQSCERREGKGRMGWVLGAAARHWPPVQAAAPAALDTTLVSKQRQRPARPSWCSPLAGEHVNQAVHGAAAGPARRTAWRPSPPPFAPPARCLDCLELLKLPCTRSRAQGGVRGQCRLPGGVLERGHVRTSASQSCLARAPP